MTIPCGTVVLGALGLVAIPGEANLDVIAHLIAGAVVDAGIHHVLARLGALELRARQSPFFDSLTGLGNLRLLSERARCWNQDDGRGATLLCIGLNRFKIINRDLGRAAGDELLPMVAQRLVLAAPVGSTVARLGGDEFVVFAPGLCRGAEPRRLAKALLAKLRESFVVQGHAVHVGARVGVAVRHGRPCDLDELMRHAEAAMHRAKRRANAIDELSWHGARDLSHTMLLDRELRKALDDGKLSVEFQPIADLQSGRIVGAEALARWNHEALGAVPPADFIPIAEEGGLIHAIDQLVCKTALHHLQQWGNRGWNGWVSVNLSAESLGRADLIQFVCDGLRRQDIPPGRLIVEVTESRAMRDPETTASFLHEMKRAGVGVALDDFGKGYSSLAYLKVFPVDLLKIDHDFVDGIGVDVRDEQLLEAVVELARRRGVAVVAEGVEHEQQLTWLAQHGCRYVQGFLVGRSVCADALCALGNRLVVKSATGLQGEQHV